MDRLVEAEPDVPALLRSLHDAGDGALVLFLGRARRTSVVTDREVRSLHYEAYPELAETRMRQIEDDVGKADGTTRVRLVHRVGTVPIGGITIAVAATAPHRAAAFHACRQALERVKREAPIWKKEVYDDDATWIHPDHAATRAKDA